MPELLVNIHMHTRYSDGYGLHKDLAKAAISAGLDAIIVTDHNVWVNGLEGYYQEGNRRVLVLIGEEVHDRNRVPQKNHMLIIGANREMTSYAPNPQRLIDHTVQSGGLAFIAHPIDLALPAFGEDNISWVDWDVNNFTGIELWNGFSELKTVVKNLLQGVFYAFNPKYIAHGPLPETLKIWDRLTGSGARVVAIAGSDAHALPKHLGPLHRTLFPYEFHYRAINVHLIAAEELSGEAARDRHVILEALRAGHAFIANDMLYSARGFRFTACANDGTVDMGDEISVRGGVTLQVHLPMMAECRLIKDGEVLKTWHKKENIVQVVTEPGVYRVEVYLNALGAHRGWIFSNPIYLRP